MMVKGVGYRGGVAPLDENDPQVFTRAEQAERALRSTVKRSLASPDSVRKSLNPNFLQQYGLFMGNNPQAQALEQLYGAVQMLLADSGKNMTLTSPLTTGFVPYNLLAPARLLYPFYSPMRNKIARTQGQGTAVLLKAITAVTGSGGYGASTGAPQRITMSELNGSTLSTYPIALPAAGAQTANDQTIPYKFMGMTEALSWLAQFSGQGFEDIAALVNLILMQQFMMAEEYQILSGSKTAITTPAAPTVAIRTAGSNESPVTAPGGGNSIYVRVTATNFYGETVMSAATEAAVGATATDVLDVTMVLPRNAWNWNIYVAVAAAGSAPATRTLYFQQAKNIGATKFTIQGTIVTSGTNPPAADSGTAGTNDYEGLLSVLDGHATTDAAVYPAGYSASYVNKNVGKQLGINVLNDLLQGAYDALSITPNSTLVGGKFIADPSELITSGVDLRGLSDNITKNGAGTNYSIFIQQSEVGGIKAGAAVSEFQNPITRSTLKLLAHPWFPAGTAIAMSYQLPVPNSNVSNTVEMNMVQDYLAISWPVIDIAFRYSLFALGTLAVYAPQYFACVQGLQRSDTTPYS